MGLFNKLKNALFEEEEIELPVKETIESNRAPIVKEESVIKKPSAPVAVEKKEIEDILAQDNERELFKSDNTFKFPEFDEEEFSSSYKPPIEETPKREPVITPKESFDRVKPITYEEPRKPKLSRKENLKKEETSESKNTKEKTFKPSPVISPVYGVLDKNYKKEDIITVKEEPKKRIDVDTIRKKAFGTLEDDIEMSFNKPKDEFYRSGSKTVDDLLNESADDTININFEKREKRNERFTNNFGNDEETEEVNSRAERQNRKRSSVEAEFDNQTEVENEFDDNNEKLQPLDVNTKDEEQRFEEDTLENDLFDLIDSMYDNREDDEE